MAHVEAPAHTGDAGAYADNSSLASNSIGSSLLTHEAQGTTRIF